MRYKDFSHPAIAEWEKRTGLDYESDLVSCGERTYRSLAPDGSQFVRGVSGTEIIPPSGPQESLENRLRYWQTKLALGVETFTRLKASLTNPRAMVFTQHHWPRELGAPSGNAIEDLKFLKEKVEFLRERVHFYSSALAITAEETGKSDLASSLRQAESKAAERHFETVRLAQEISI